MPGPTVPRMQELPAGTTFGRYAIVRRIGAGGMAAVYEAQHTHLGRRVALKILHPSYAVHAPSVERFVLEANAAARLQHPHVVDVFDVGVEDDVPFMVMEYLEGGDLGAILEQENSLTVERVCALMLPVVSAVSAAHRAGIVHRDLKPENIYVTLGLDGIEHPVLLDFGISKVARRGGEPNLSMAGELLGTPYYMAPEQIRADDKVDARSDQYSLGVIIYECVTGQRPYRAGDSVYVLMAEILSGQADPPSTINRSLSPDFEAVILRAMNAVRDDRFESMQSFGRALMPFASEATRTRWTHEFDPRPSEGKPASAPAVAATGRASRPSTIGRRTTRLATGAALGSQSVSVPPDDLRVLTALRESSPDELAMFALLAPARRYPKDALLFLQGTQGESCFMLLRGEVEIVKSMSFGDCVLNTLGPGSVVGQIALVDLAPRTASVIARTETVAIELTREVFDKLIATANRVALRFQEHIAISAIRQLRVATQQLTALLDERASLRARGTPDVDPSHAARLAYVQAATLEWDLALEANRRAPTPRILKREP